MRFTLAAIIALAPLVAAKDVYERIDEFSNISSTDSAAFSSWRQGYESAYKTWVASYLDEYGSQSGYSSTGIAGVKRDVLANADAVATEGYGYFYNAFIATETGYDFATETGAPGAPGSSEGSSGSSGSSGAPGSPGSSGSSG
ncbi:hypothetical protein OXX59_008246, partial [Metschnikowia pulcherrima]